MKLTINLASRRFVNEQALKSTLTVVLTTLVIVLILQGMTWMQSHEQNLTYLQEINALEEQLRGKIPKRFSKEQIAEQQLRFSQAEALLQKDAFRWTALFDRFEKLLPANVSIRSFSPNYEKGSLAINGVAKDLIDLQDLLDNLHADNFDQVFLKTQSQVEVKDYMGSPQPALSFAIQLEGVFNNDE